MKIYAINKKATFNYQIIESYQAGIVLFGFEVKSVKTGNVHLQGSYVVIEEGEVFLVNVLIPPYQPSNTPSGYDSQRKRKLLFNKNEINTILSKKSASGLTIIPIKMYNNKNNIKVEVALARGKKKYDKREDIKKRDIKREIARMSKLR